jgi:hypothetical protein
MRNVATATRHLARLAGDDSRISFEGTLANTDLPKVSGVRQEETETLRRLRHCDTPRSSLSLLEELVQKKILHFFEAGQLA